jgi:hypothetical protein
MPKTGKCKNCNHDVYIVMTATHVADVRHRIFSTQVFPHYEVTRECGVKGCDCKEAA